MQGYWYVRLWHSLCHVALLMKIRAYMLRAMCVLSAKTNQVNSETAIIQSLHG